jgi:hypothetical protein
MLDAQVVDPHRCAARSDLLDVAPVVIVSPFSLPISNFRYPVNLQRAWQIVQAIIGAADASSRVLAPAPRAVDPSEPPAGLIGHLEARLTGVVVSALKEAFDRDAARLEVERAALEEQRRRAAEALRLELVRQAADRAVTRLRATGGLALAIWIVSVFFVMRFPDGFAGAGRVVLGAGWACLAAAIAACFAAHAATVRWSSRALTSSATADEAPEGGVAAAPAWLVLAGLVLVGASLLMAL